MLVWEVLSARVEKSWTGTLHDQAASSMERPRARSEQPLGLSGRRRLGIHRFPCCSFCLFDRLCLWNCGNDSDIPVLVGNIGINCVEVIRHLLASIGSQRTCVMAWSPLARAPAATGLLPPLGGDVLVISVLLLSIAVRACRVNAGDTSRVRVMTTVMPSFDQTS